MSPSHARRRRGFAWVLLGGTTLLLSGCVGLQAEWFPAEPDRWATRVSKLEEQEHAAIILRREKHYVLHYSQQSRLEELNHAAIHVITEAGIDALASFAFTSRRGAELKDFGARVVQPDGEIVELEGVTVYTVDTLVEGETLKRTFFRIPGVVIGSTVEFYTLYVYAGLPPLLKERVSQGLPVLEYAVSIDVAPKLGYEFRTYNTDRKARVERRAGGGARVTFTMKDIPGRESEAFGADGSLTEPWWLLGITSYGTAPSSLSSWDRAMRQQTEALLVDDDEKYFDDPDLEIDVKGCSDATCKVERALTFLRDRASFAGFNEWYRARPMSEVLKSGYANNHEKAYLLFAALENLGFSPQLAAVSRYLTRGYDFELPSGTWFNHHVVFLSAGNGIAGGVVIDPSCEYCSLGELPTWSTGQKALLYSRDLKTAVMGKVTATTSWLTLPSKSPALATQRFVIDVALAKKSGGQVKLQRSWRGRAAVSPSIYDRSQDDQRRSERLENHADLRHGVDAELTQERRRHCEREQGLCEEGYDADLRYAGFRTRDRILVPLTFLFTDYDDDLRSDERHHDLVITRDLLMEEVLNLAPPEGYSLKEAPEAHAESEAFSFSLAVTSTPAGARVTRRLRLKAGRYPKADYEALRAPLRAYDVARKSLVVFQR